jgi:predicted lysophospholipase L1 biosynthesis ABC-type transport system permease subunit
VRYQNIKEPVPPTVYIPFRQFPLRLGAYFAVRTALPPLELATAVRKAVAAVDPAVPVMRLATQEQLVNRTISQERLSAVLCAVLGGFALLLSCIGLYGLMAYHVTRRRGEIAIRLAIGARPGEVAGSVVKEALALTMGGIALGLPAVLALARLVKNHLHGVAPNDPVALALAAGTLAAVALLSAWLPARRAARVDPVVALRSD